MTKTGSELALYDTMTTRYISWSRKHMGLMCGKTPYTELGWPSLVDLRADPFERAMHESIDWGMWSTKRMYVLSGAAIMATDFLKTFLDFLQRQAPGSSNVDTIITQLEAVRAAGQ